jgi:hypothetical protein
MADLVVRTGGFTAWHIFGDEWRLRFVGEAEFACPTYVDQYDNVWVMDDGRLVFGRGKHGDEVVGRGYDRDSHIAKMKKADFDE